MGIRSRLLIMLALVLAIGGAGLGWLLSRSTTNEFLLLIDEQRQQALPSLSETGGALVAAYQGGGWESLTQRLVELSPPGSGYFLVLLTPDRGALSSDPAFAIVDVQQQAELIRVELHNQQTGSRYVLLERKQDTIELSAGSIRLGRLLRLSLPGRNLSHPQQRFLDQTRLTLVLLLATALIAALLIVYFLGSRITRPLQQLADASQRISAGEFGHQVPVTGSDEVGRLGQRFNQMSRQLQQQEQVRKQMVSDIAHELRTPITGMRCNLEALRDGLIEFQRDTAEELYADALQLQRLVDDLQELSLAEAGALRLHPVPTDLAEVAESAIRALPITDAAQRIRIRQPESLRVVRIDAGRLRQVLINLLHNALTHSPGDSPVELQIAQGRTDSSIRVLDCGAGVDESELAKLFDRFYRTDSARQRSAGGSGLGLAICKQLVTLMGGQISAHQRLPSGLRVELLIPDEATVGNVGQISPSTADGA